MIPSILKNMSLALEGQGYLGKVDELVLPKLSLKTEEHRGGGMDAPVEIDMGMEALTAEMTMAGLEPDVLGRFAHALLDKHLGFATATDRLVMRGAYEDGEGNTQAVKVQMSGKAKEADLGTWKAGEKAGAKYTFTLTYLEITVDGTQLVEIDVPNMVRRINGTDQLEAQRNAIQV